MLKSLTLKDVGPSSVMEIEFARRMNLLTGDNGLGKTFLLDMAWWALTRTWASYPAIPHRGEHIQPRILFSFEGQGKQELRYEAKYDWKEQAWVGKAGRPAIPGMVLYARVDGSFAVWDPARNYWRKKGNIDIQDRPPAYLFQPHELWEGLREDGHVLCNGLLADWVIWQKEKGDYFQQLEKVVRVLSPSVGESLAIGALTRISLDDVRDYPTVRMLYGQDVPITHASAGIKRILALAYMLVWTWQEHTKASQLLNQPYVREMIFLIDEIEAHLHPRWQRSIVRSLLEVMDVLTGHFHIPVQLVIATHSPLILASTEPLFRPDDDALWELGCHQGQVRLLKDVWSRRGDVNAWLQSEIFELEEPGSLEREAAFRKARAFMRESSPHLATALEIDGELRVVLGSLDPFWVRWSAFVDKLRNENQSRGEV